MSKDPIVYTARVSPTRDICLSCDKGIDAGDMYIAKSRRHFGVTEYCISCACENIEVGERDGVLPKKTPIYIEEHLADDKRYSGALNPLIDYRIPLRIKEEVKTMYEDKDRTEEREEVSPYEETDSMTEAVVEPPAPHIPTIMSKLKGSVDMPEEFKFADSTVFYTMLRNIFRGKSILVTGPSGCGKSSLGKILADITNKPYYAFNFGDTMNPAAKILGDTKYDSERGTFFKKSRFVSALQDTQGSFIMLDEVTRDRTGDLANILMPVLDGQKYLALDESDDADTVDINANAFFYATANIGREYLGAAHDLDRAWKDRFTGGIYELEYLPQAKEQELLMIRSPSLDEQDAKRITDFASRVRDLYAAEEISTAVSTRMCLSTAEFVVDGMSLIDALKQVCLPFYPIVAGDDGERVQVIQTIQSMGD